MPAFNRFLRCLGKAVAKHGLRAFACLVPMGGELYDLAWDVWSNYQGEQKDAELRAELQALAQAKPAEARKVAEEVTREVAGDQPADLQLALTSYLTQVPATVRQSFRRSADPDGTTVPATLALKKPEDLLPFLPTRLPRFKPGDCPPGVGDWELVELLGVGGFGEVWKARHATLASRKPVALKFCLDATAATALRNEARLLDRVMQHGSRPGIVPLLQTYLRADPPCLEYEYVEGGDLTGLVQEQLTEGGASPEFAAKTISQLARTIAFAHRLDPPIVHRDLKPANILVQRRPDGGVDLLIADFGIGGIAAAQVIQQEVSRPVSLQQRLPTAVRGAFTPLYASPQQRRAQPPDVRDDVHALGVIWHQLLVGDLGAERPGGRGWRKKLEQRGMPVALLDVLESCLEDDPDERPADAGDLAERIEAMVKPGTTSTSTRLTPAAVLLKPMKNDALPKEITNSLGTKLVSVGAGHFWMGDRGNQWQVEVPHTFYIGVFPVTQGEWQAVMGNNPSHFSRGGGGADKVKGFSDDDLKQFPVEQVSWEDAQEFIRRLTAREKDTGYQYRLPTEAEWEYSCRGGGTPSSDFDFYFAQPTNDLSSEQANFDGRRPVGNAPKGKYLGRTSGVGSYKPNRLGIYDLHGNVWEWCEGHFRAGDSARVFRGGSWYINGRFCRASNRNSYEPSKRLYDLGFRLVALPSS
jgi:formylglycine-generating enzyme required for sulfatase activity